MSILLPEVPELLDVVEASPVVPEDVEVLVVDVADVIEVVDEEEVVDEVSTPEAFAPLVSVVAGLPPVVGSAVVCAGFVVAPGSVALVAFETAVMVVSSLGGPHAASAMRAMMNETSLSE